METVRRESGGGQRLRFWIDTDGDGDFSDKTCLLNTNTVDDDWSAGYVGLFRHGGGSTIQQFDDVTVGFDTNADDAIDDTQVADNFDSNSFSLAYDNNGNLTDDGVYLYVYDAWNP